jgi:purine nucleosidase
MALRAPEVCVRAITTVAGNVPVEQATRNALYVVELCASNVPVYGGAARPILREHAHAEWFHGKDGLGDHGYAPRVRVAESGHAADAIIAAVQAHPGIVLVTLGPLTNVAIALSKAPGIAASVGRCVVMGGNPCCEGNVTPAAEYNMWVDPEAARVVFRSGLPIELVGWHLCRGEAVLNAADIEYTLSLHTPPARFAVECNSRAMEAYRIQTGETGISLPDPVAMCVALDKTVCTSVGRHYLDVEVSSDLTRGMTVVDRLGVACDERNRTVWQGLVGRVPQVEVVWSIDNARWKRRLYAALEGRMAPVPQDR